MSPSEAKHQMVWSNEALAGRGVRVEQAALAAGGHRHADGVADALPERAGGGLDAGGVPVLGVAGGERAPGAQRLEVVELQAVAGQVELDVEGQAGVPAGQHEPVATGPVRVGRVVPQVALEEQVRRRRQAHRGAGVAVADLLDRVHGQARTVSTARWSRSVHSSFGVLTGVRAPSTWQRAGHDELRREPTHRADARTPVRPTDTVGLPEVPDARNDHPPRHQRRADGTRFV